MHAIPPILLASKSPRRSQLLAEAGLIFRVETEDCLEDYPEEMLAEEVPVFLARKKAQASRHLLRENEVLLSADTVVLLDGEIIGKPTDEADAYQILSRLSGKVHRVITGVCLLSAEKEHSFSAVSAVHFEKLSEEEKQFYIQNYQPMDKAGAYGIQDWIGHCKVRKITGTYTNIMGLPVNMVYRALLKKF